MSTSNARLSNHMAAPATASFVAAMRAAFGKIDVTYVNECPVNLGAPLAVADTELVSYVKSRLIKGKTVYSSISYTIGRFAV